MSSAYPLALHVQLLSCPKCATHLPTALSCHKPKPQSSLSLSWTLERPVSRGLPAPILLSHCQRPPDHQGFVLKCTTDSYTPLGKMHQWLPLPAEMKFQTFSTAYEAPWDLAQPCLSCPWSPPLSSPELIFLPQEPCAPSAPHPSFPLQGALSSHGSLHLAGSSSFFHFQLKCCFFKRVPPATCSHPGLCLPLVSPTPCPP